MAPPRLESLQYGELIPDDLDFVAWVDLERLRGLFGDRPENELWALVQFLGVAAEDANLESHPMWRRLLIKGKRMWLGCRPTPKGCLDYVVVATSEQMDPPPSLGEASDLGGGWFRWDKKQATGRQDLARVYLRLVEPLVLASTTELDAVEQTVEHGTARTRLRPPERGLVSVLVRGTGLQRLMAEAAPKAAKWLGRTKLVEANLDVVLTGAELTIRLKYDGRSDAERAAEGLLTFLSLTGQSASDGDEPTRMQSQCGDSNQSQKHFVRCDASKRVTVDVIDDRIEMRVELLPKPRGSSHLP